MSPRKKKPIDDITELNKLSISVTSLRLELAELIKKGITEIPLGDLILIIRSIYRDKEQDEAE